MKAPSDRRRFDPRDVRSVSVEVADEALRRGFTAERSDDIRTAVSEACLNALEHGGGAARPPSISVQWTREGVQIVVVSDGPEFEIPAAKPDLLRKLDGLEPPRGWGLYLIRSLADEVQVRRRDGWNELSMTFAIRTNERGDDGG